VVSVAALGAYASVLVEERYVGAFFALLLVGLLSGVEIPKRSPRAAMLVGIAVLNLVLVTGMHMRRDYSDENRSKIHIGDVEAAIALREYGILPGDRVARINPRVADGWARLAKVAIVAEVRMSAVESFWKAAPATQQALLHAFAATGAKAAISYSYPRRAVLPAGWQRLGNTDYAVFRL
jgi:hypothetical protein